MIQLKHSKNFRRILEMALVDCGNNLHLNWSAVFVISVAPKELLVVALSTPDKVKLLQYLKSGFQQTNETTANQKFQ